MLLLKARRSALLALALAAGCYSPAYAPCRVSCGAGGACPSGTTCGSDGYCHRDDGEQCGAPDLATIGDLGDLGDLAVPPQPGDDGGAPCASDGGCPPPAASIAAGARHGCAIRGDGALRCWGDNSSGQLGDTTMDSHRAPVEVDGRHRDWTAVAAGEEHSCGLRGDGTLWCWGLGDDGRLGSPVNGPQPMPLPVGDKGWRFRAVSAGARHTCAIRTDGALLCWGMNDNGQLGDGTRDSRPTPRPVSGPPDGWSAVAAGRGDTCALHGSALYCWGWDENCQIGDGCPSDGGLAPPVLTPLLIEIEAGQRWSRVATGDAHTCALSDGRLYCWGSGGEGQLGNGGAQEARPRRIGVDGDWLEVTAGASHSCALRGAGVLFCFGTDSDGRLGDGMAANSRATPVMVANPPGGAVRWLEVAAGASHSCGRSSTGAVYCWGDDGEGQLGIGPIDGGLTRLTPTPIVN